MDIIKRAMLGDKKAQEEITARGWLLPCPHCGNKDYIFVESVEKIFCGNCGCSTRTFTGGAVEKVLENWNSRPQLLTDEEMERLEGKEWKN